MKANQKPRVTYSEVPDYLLKRAMRLREKFPRRRQQRKAWRRFRLRHTHGWTDSDLMTCLRAELRAGKHIGPEVILGRPPIVVGPPIAAGADAGLETLKQVASYTPELPAEFVDELKAEKEKVRRYARASPTLEYDFDPHGLKVTIGPGGES